MQLRIDSNFMSQIRDNIRNGRIDNAKIACAHSKSPVARLIEKGISRIGKPLTILIQLSKTGKLEIYK
jgi:biopolymer transport protein ExbB